MHGILFTGMNNHCSGGSCGCLLLFPEIQGHCVSRYTAVYIRDKKQLPGNNQYMEPVEWLRAVRQELGSDIVFALDSALMCEGAYLGRTDEWVIWIYGDPKLEKYNGVCVIGDSVSDHEVETRNGLRYTCFNRTLNDSLANESILDMQGITEALSRY
jgi:hypothetical protein